LKQKDVHLLPTESRVPPPNVYHSDTNPMSGCTKTFCTNTDRVTLTSTLTLTLTLVYSLS